MCDLIWVLLFPILSLLLNRMKSFIIREGFVWLALVGLTALAFYNAGGKRPDRGRCLRLWPQCSSWLSTASTPACRALFTASPP
jgi:hypothetical protein